MTKFLVATLTLSAGLFSLAAHAQSSAELSCKAQAKEIAVQTYSSCITEARNGQIEQIRKSYKEDVAALKAKYDRELKKLNGKVAKNSKKASGAPTVQEVTASKPVKGIARKLPGKAPTGEAIAVQTAVDSPTVVPVENNTSSLEKENADADNNNVEVIDMPTPEEAPAT